MAPELVEGTTNYGGTQQLVRIRDEVCLIRRNRSGNKQS